jgi:hypothetical protein
MLGAALVIVGGSLPLLFGNRFWLRIGHRIL